MCGSRFLKRALLGLCLGTTFARAQTAQQPTAKKASAKRANELTLAKLRPGRAKVTHAIALYKDPLIGKPGATSYSWEDVCRVEFLFLDTEASGKIRTVRVASHEKWSTADCKRLPPSPWKTGHGLRVGDSAVNVVQLYGDPDSRSPSTKGGQPLELFHYAFDWAGPDVPQVMEVLCTKDKDGQPGRVLEITLAATSL